jgi:parallel beta-helix repeat protein
MLAFWGRLVGRRAKRAGVKRRRTFQPRIDVLEERRVLATIWVDDDLMQRPSADFTSIQAAVAAADPGDTIRVAAGTYEESVTVDKSLDIRAHHDASPRANRSDRNAILEIPAGGMWGFNVTADDVEIRGFVIEDSNDDGNGPVGVILGRQTSGHDIRRNIIQSNTFGIYLNSDGEDKTVVRENLIRDNNQPGAAAGNGIYSDQGVSDVDVVGNTFTGHTNSAMVFAGGSGAFADDEQSDILIRRNVIVNDSSIALFNVTASEISQNLSTGSNGSGIFLGGGVNDVVIRHNALANGATTGINVQTLGVDANSNIDIVGNSITGFGEAGIRLTGGANEILVSNNVISRNGTDGISLEEALDNVIERNRLDRNGRDGIRVDALSLDNLLSRNDASRNAEHDYHDDSVGTGTAGTANTWTRNRGRTQNRPGLIN